EALGAGQVRVFAGWPDGGAAERWPAMVAALRDAAAFAGAAGLRLVLENEAGFTPSAAEHIRILADVGSPHLGLLLDTGNYPGGSALYAGLFAHRQGLRVGLFTSYGPDFPFEVLPPEVEVVAVPAAATTRFAIEYGPGGRSLALRARAAALDAQSLPPHFAEAGIAYLGPVANEVAPELADAFPNAAVGAGAQGWCRLWDRDGLVRMRPWPEPEPVLARIQALFLSGDDVAGWEAYALPLYQEVPLGALTYA